MKLLLKLFLLITGLICSVKTQQKDCGKPRFTSGLIVGNGMNSAPGEWPWLASIFQVDPSIDERIMREISNADERESYVCGSTLISNSHVLTGKYEGQ